MAIQLGVNEHTVLNWERGKWPIDRHLPLLLRFLGYDPRPEPQTFGERLRMRRQALGLSCKAAAKVIGIDEGTLSRWERGIWNPTGDRRAMVVRFLSSDIG